MHLFKQQVSFIRYAVNLIYDQSRITKMTATAFINNINKWETNLFKIRDLLFAQISSVL